MTLILRRLNFWMRLRMNYHGLAGAKRHSRRHPRGGGDGNLIIYSEIYSVFTIYRLGGNRFLIAELQK